MDQRHADILTSEHRLGKRLVEERRCFNRLTGGGKFHGNTGPCKPTRKNNQINHKFVDKNGLWGNVDKHLENQELVEKYKKNGVHYGKASTFSTQTGMNPNCDFRIGRYWHKDQKSLTLSSSSSSSSSSSNSTKTPYETYKHLVQLLEEKPQTNSNLAAIEDYKLKMNKRTADNDTGTAHWKFTKHETSDFGNGRCCYVHSEVKKRPAGRANKPRKRRQRRVVPTDYVLPKIRCKDATCQKARSDSSKRKFRCPSCKKREKLTVSL